VTAALRLGAFAGALAALFAGGLVVGDLFGPEREASATGAGHGGEHPGGRTDRGVPAHPVRGLAVADGGLRLVVDDTELERGRSETLRYRVVDDAGETVRDFDVEHERRMHLIVARRDLSGFQHLHPEQQPDGSWRTALRLDEAGSYRLFADFVHRGAPSTLASDLRVDGPADLRALPAPEPAAVSDGGYDVRLDSGRARPGAEAKLRFTVTRDAEPVHTEPYLGAGGHLVALREGDLAFLHVHPEDHGHEAGGSAGEHDDGIGFAATFPTAGRYRLFLQFKHEGRVHTVAFTREVS
jgi:hypothetical protein